MAQTAKGGIATAKPITVSIDGTDYELVPSIAAVRGVNEALGGLKPALAAVQNLNYDAAAVIINAGSGGRMKFKELQALGEALWTAEDKSEAMGAVLDFLVLLLNGGRPVSTDDGGKTQDKTEGN